MEKIMYEIRDILSMYKYPLIGEMNQEEFFNIFHRSNRYFLLSWIMNQLDTCFEDLLEGDKKEDILEEYLYQFGICSKDESSGIIKGILEPVREIELIHQFVKFMKKVQTIPVINNQERTTIYDIEILMANDLNLFPMFGDIRIAETMREISNTSEDSDQALSDQGIAQIDFAENSNLIKVLSDNISKIKKFDGSPKKSTCPSLDAELLQNCCQNITILSQYLQDLTVVDSFLKFEETAHYEQSSIDDLRATFETLLTSVSNYLDDDI